jgi:hypothetical protein
MACAEDQRERDRDAPRVRDAVAAAVALAIPADGFQKRERALVEPPLAIGIGRALGDQQIHQQQCSHEPESAVGAAIVD